MTVLVKANLPYPGFSKTSIRLYETIKRLSSSEVPTLNELQLLEVAFKQAAKTTSMSWTRSTQHLCFYREKAKSRKSSTYSSLQEHMFDTVPGDRFSLLSSQYQTNVFQMRFLVINYECTVPDKSKIPHVNIIIKRQTKEWVKRVNVYLRNGSYTTYTSVNNL